MYRMFVSQWKPGDVIVMDNYVIVHRHHANNSRSPEEVGENQIVCASAVGKYTPEKRASRGRARVKKMAEEDAERDAEDEDDVSTTGSDEEMQTIDLAMDAAKLAQKQAGEKIAVDFDDFKVEHSEDGEPDRESAADEKDEL